MPLVKLDEFSAHYDGEALDDHEMDVTALGPALLAFGDIVRAAYRVIEPLDERKPVVKVQEFKPGSFEVVLSIDLTLIEQAVSLLNGRYATAAATAAGIGTPIVTVITAAIMAIKKRADSGEETTQDELRSELGDELRAKQAHRLQHDPKFVDGVKKATKPVVGEGIDELTIKTRGGHNDVSVNKDEAKAISEIESTEEKSVYYDDLVVTVSTPHMDDPMKRQWRFENKDLGAFKARLLDSNFAELIKQGKVSFQTGVKFDAKVRVEEVMQHGEAEPKRSYEIVEMKPIPSGEQGNIFES